jgi:hypothetical protein
VPNPRKLTIISGVAKGSRAALGLVMADVSVEGSAGVSCVSFTVRAQLC